MRGLAFLLPFFGGGSDISLSNTMPVSEATMPQAGTGSTASRDDHVHPRLTSSHSNLVVGAGGTTTVMFTRTFATKPAIVPCAIQAAGVSTPVMIEGQSWIQDGTGAYTGVVLRAYKGALVTVAVLGVQLNVFNGNAAGVEFSLVAVQTS